MGAQEEYKIGFQTPGEMLDLCFLRLLVIDSGYGGGNRAKEEDGLVGKVCVCLAALQPGLFLFLALFFVL